MEPKQAALTQRVIDKARDYQAIGPRSIRQFILDSLRNARSAFDVENLSDSEAEMADEVADLIEEIESEE